MVNIHAALARTRDQFRSAGLDTPELDARLLMQAATGLRHEELLMRYNEPVSDAQSDALNKMVQRRLLREPVSRILGVRAFWKSEFKISRETLDPRADSETLIEAVLDHVPHDRPLSILDLGTGSGCLLLSLLQELPEATGLGVDISADAIQTAHENAATLGLSNRVKFMVNNWTELKINNLFDIVISNPPYISDSEIAVLAPEVKEYDPVRALSGGADGLSCYREIISLLPKLIQKTGFVFMEIGATQAESVKEMLAKSGLHMIQTAQDLAGHDRCVVASMSSVISVKEKRMPLK